MCNTPQKICPPSPPNISRTLPSVATVHKNNLNVTPTPTSIMSSKTSRARRRSTTQIIKSCSIRIVPLRPPSRTLRLTITLVATTSRILLRQHPSSTQRIDGYLPARILLQLSSNQNLSSLWSKMARSLEWLDKILSSWINWGKGSSAKCTWSEKSILASSWPWKC